MRLPRSLAAILLLAASLSVVTGQSPRTLIVFAASSLTDAFEEIGATFETENPGVDVLFNFGGSSTLGAQLSEGAEADVFASANQRQMAAAQEAGRIAGEPRVFARNRLALIVPADNPAQIESLADLQNPGVVLVIAAEGVPVRDYTETMLTAMSADPAHGQMVVVGIRANVRSEEPNVRQVTAKVALGEADAGIVYSSDVTPDIRESVIQFEIPDAFNVIAEYPIAVVEGAGDAVLAQSFVEFVHSDAGQDTLERWGFVRGVPERRCWRLLFIPVCR
ncbi:MAG: molybdate ABC transporter substrate-binding protein [Chloroflexi bacterium]|nr:molybdate ABC transporter substrate-binding protein [Chloroflexota bacterium]